jgi:fluoroquinolone transport system permease protein
MQSLSSADGKGISRDPLMRVMLFVPFGLALAVRLVLPGAVRAASIPLGFDLMPIALLLASYMLLILPPMICGMLVGFLLLDQRDEQTLLAIRVTPLPLAGYLAYRLATPFVLGMLSSAAALAIAGLISAPLLALVVATFAAAPIAPLSALFLAVFGANKVQGLALQKLLSIPLILPFLGILLPYPWDLAAIIAPTLWPANLLWQLQAGGAIDWVAFMLALGYQGVLGVLLLRRL